MEMKHTAHDLDYSDPDIILSCKPCFDFYQKYVAISDDKKSTIQQMTIDQADGENIQLWKACRKIRISAGEAKKVQKRESTCPANLLEGQLYKPFTGNAATELGRLSEPFPVISVLNHVHQ